MKGNRKTKPKAKMGRKLINIRKESFENLCGMFCTLPEVAYGLGVSEDTVERFCIREYGETYAETYKKVCCTGKISLRRSQFRSDIAGNVTMLIWLGKQYLEQSDKVEQITNRPNEQLNYNFQITPEQLKDLYAGNNK